jgi:hypothetical protein
LQPFVGVRRGQPDVDDDDVGQLRLEQLAKIVCVSAPTDDFESRNR